jgi:hypothetical protein
MLKAAHNDPGRLCMHQTWIRQGQATCYFRLDQVSGFALCEVCQSCSSCA